MVMPTMRLTSATKGILKKSIPRAQIMPIIVESIILPVIKPLNFWLLSWATRSTSSITRLGRKAESIFFSWAMSFSLSESI